VRADGRDDVHPTSGTIWDAHRRNFPRFVIKEKSQTGKSHLRPT
jgi:hypothetical protein